MCKNQTKDISSDPLVVPDVLTGNSRRGWAQHAPNSPSLPPVWAGRGLLGMLRGGSLQSPQRGSWGVFASGHLQHVTLREKPHLCSCLDTKLLFLPRSRSLGLRKRGRLGGEALSWWLKGSAGSISCDFFTDPSLCPSCSSTDAIGCDCCWSQDTSSCGLGASRAVA